MKNERKKKKTHTEQNNPQPIFLLPIVVLIFSVENKGNSIPFFLSQLLRAGMKYNEMTE